jgi:hypothetical protein
MQIVDALNEDGMLRYYGECQFEAGGLILTRNRRIIRDRTWSNHGGDVSGQDRQDGVGWRSQPARVHRWKVSLFDFDIWTSADAKSLAETLSRSHHPRPF